jgi:hypothetical protein
VVKLERWLYIILNSGNFSLPFALNDLVNSNIRVQIVGVISRWFTHESRDILFDDSEHHILSYEFTSIMEAKGCFLESVIRRAYMYALDVIIWCDVWGPYVPYIAVHNAYWDLCVLIMNDAVNHPYLSYSFGLFNSEWFTLEHMSVWYSVTSRPAPLFQ